MKEEHESCSHSHDEEKQPSSAKVLNSEIEASATTTLLVAGVDCSEEVAAIETALKQTDHVREVNVSILSGKATIQHDGNPTDPYEARDVTEIFQPPPEMRQKMDAKTRSTASEEGYEGNEKRRGSNTLNNAVQTLCGILKKSCREIPTPDGELDVGYGNHKKMFRNIGSRSEPSFRLNLAPEQIEIPPNLLELAQEIKLKHDLELKFKYWLKNKGP